VIGPEASSGISAISRPSSKYNFSGVTSMTS
jgi:hypothetical protein